MRFMLPSSDRTPMRFVGRSPWGFTDPEVTMVDRRGRVSVRPMSVESGYLPESELDANGFDGHIFRDIEADWERVSYLHSTGYAAIHVPEGFVVRLCGDGLCVDDEDDLRSEYHRWSTRKTRMPPTKVGRCPFALNQDAKVAVATASVEEGPHWTIAAEYIAYRDDREGIRGYDTSTMNRTLLTVRDIGTAEPDALSDASADVLGCSEREEDDSLADYLEDLGMRLRRLRGRCKALSMDFRILNAVGESGTRLSDTRVRPKVLPFGRAASNPGCAVRRNGTNPRHP